MKNKHKTAKDHYNLLPRYRYLSLDRFFSLLSTFSCISNDSKYRECIMDRLQMHSSRWNQPTILVNWVVCYYLSAQELSVLKMNKSTENIAEKVPPRFPHVAGSRFFKIVQRRSPSTSHISSQENTHKTEHMKFGKFFWCKQHDYSPII